MIEGGFGSAFGPIGVEREPCRPDRLRYAPSSPKFVVHLELSRTWTGEILWRVATRVPQCSQTVTNWRELAGMA